MRLAYTTLVKTFDAWRGEALHAAEERAAREARALTMAAHLMNPYVGMTFAAWVEHVERCLEIKKRAAFAIGPGRLLHMVMRTWA